MTRPKQRAKTRRAEPAARPAAMVVFDSTVPVYMETVRETRICPELIQLPEDVMAIAGTTDPTSTTAPTGSAATAARQMTRTTASDAGPDGVAQSATEPAPSGSAASASIAVPLPPRPKPHADAALRASTAPVSTAGRVTTVGTQAAEAEPGDPALARTGTAKQAGAAPAGTPAAEAEAATAKAREAGKAGAADPKAGEAAPGDRKALTQPSTGGRAGTGAAVEPKGAAQGGASQTQPPKVEAADTGAADSEPEASAQQGTDGKAATNAAAKPDSPAKAGVSKAKAEKAEAEPEPPIQPSTEDKEADHG